MSAPSVRVAPDGEIGFLAIVLLLISWWGLDLGEKWIDRAYPLERDNKCMTDTRPDFEPYEEMR